MKKIAHITLLAALLVSLAVPALAAGKGKPPVGPGDTIEFVSCFGPGGGHDVMLRTMEKAIRENSIFPNPIIFTYKPGGNQAVGMMHTRGQGGRSDLLMSTTNSLINMPLQMDVGVKYTDLTSLAVWGTQYHFFWVKKDKAEKEGWKTLEDLIKYSEQPGKHVTFTTSGVGSLEELIVEHLKTAHPNADLRILAVDGDAEAVVQLLGDHVEVMINEPAGGGTENYAADGDIIALVTSGAERSTFFPEVPTLTELGYNYSSDGFRGIMGPPNMSPEAIAWWQDILTKISNTDTFKEYMKVNGIEPKFLIGDALDAYFLEYKDNMRGAFTLAGIKTID